MLPLIGAKFGYIAYILVAAAALVLVPGMGELGGTGERLAMVGFLLTFPLALGFLLYRYFRSDSIRQKQQIKWVVFSVGVMLGVLLVNTSLGWLLPQAWMAAGAPGDILTTLLGSSSIVFFWLCIAVSVYRYRLFDIDLIIRRTLVYGGLSAAITGLYILTVTGMAGLLQWGDGRAPLLMALLPVGLVLRPLYSGLQRAVNRLVPVTEVKRERLAASTRSENLFDIGMVVNRILVYTGLTFSVIGLYVLFVWGLGGLVHLQGNLLLSLVATGLIALTFHPLRERLQRGVNRLLYGYRDEPYQVIAQLGRRLEATFDPASVLPATVETVAEALKLPYAAIALTKDGEMQRLTHYGQAQAREETFPLIYGGELLGELVVSPRPSEEALSRADRWLLADLARQVGVAAHALLLQADLERSRLRIVTAREEARRQLGNDLHDSVGHQLTGLMRRAETAGNLLEQHPEEARWLLQELVSQGRAAEHVRALAHQLHPPELEVLGLLGVIREWAEAEGGGLQVHLELPNSLPKLPAAVEVAAYCIVREALQNIHKHAQARRCIVRLALVRNAPLVTSVLTALDAPVLEIDVLDDGRGFAKPSAAGLGLSSMRERAAEVGGTCRVDSLPRGGTRVVVRLPCPEEH
jgi:signal transduction histidine kinase